MNNETEHSLTIAQQRELLNCAEALVRICGQHMRWEDYEHGFHTWRHAHTTVRLCVLTMRTPPLPIIDPPPVDAGSDTEDAKSVIGDHP